MIAQRDAFFNSLFELAKTDKRIVLISADMGAPSLDQWRLELPHQFINVGVAEQNAINVATGMALEGFLPFVYAIAPFISLRVVEQIKNGPAIHNLPVTLVGIGAGLSYADAGPTHHTIEDLRIISSIPNMTVVTCTDSAMAAVLPQLALTGVPLYIRLDRDTKPDLYPHITLQDIERKYPINKLAKDRYYVASCGDLFHTVHTVCKKLEINSIDLFRVPFLDSLRIDIPKSSRILVVEEGIGLRTALLEYVNDEQLDWSISGIGIKSYVTDYGGRKLMREWCKLDEETLSATIQQWRPDANIS